MARRQTQQIAAPAGDTVPVSIRFPRGKLKQIQRVAQMTGESASNWIRRRALEALNEQAAA